MLLDSYDPSGGIAFQNILLWNASHLRYLVRALAICILHLLRHSPLSLAPDITNTKCSGIEKFFEYLEMGDL